MADHALLRGAYMLGCKIAADQLNNANDLHRIFMAGRQSGVPDSEQRVSDKDPVLSNQEEEIRSTTGSSWGPKHQLSTNPEWV